MKKLSIAVLCLAVALPALAKPAADNLSKGCAFYNSGQYDKALAYLQDTVSKNPRAWKGHYYLANTYVALGQRDAALEQYQLCQGCKPTADVALSCQNMASRLAATATRGGMPVYPGNIRSRNTYVGTQKAEIIRQANRETDRMREATDARILSGQNTAGGTADLKWGASTEAHENARRLQLDTEQKAAVLMEGARKKIQNMR